MGTWIWIKGISYDDIMELYIEMQTTAWFTFPYDNWGGIDEIRYRSYYLHKNTGGKLLGFYENVSKA